MGWTFQATDPQKKKKGVATYVQLWINPKLRWASEDGRILIIEIQTEVRTILIVNTYVPNSDQDRFYRDLHERLNIWSSCGKL